MFLLYESYLSPLQVIEKICFRYSFSDGWAKF